MRTTGRALASVAVVIFIGLCLWNIFGAQKVCWFDEAFSIETVNKGVSKIDFGQHDVHPPGYYLSLAGWMEMRPASLGQCDWGRMLSVVFGCIFLIAAYCGMVRFVGQRGAGIATVFLGMTPTLVHYGTEARMYILVLALTAVAWSAMVTWGRRGVPVAAAVLLVLPSIHYYAVLAFIPLVLTYLVVVERRPDEEAWGNVSVMVATTLAGAVFAYAMFAGPQIARSEGMWFGKSTLQSLPSGIAYAFFPPQYDLIGTLPMLVSVVVLVAIVAIGAWMVFGKKESDLARMAWVGYAMIAVPAAALLVVPAVNLVTGFEFGNIYHHRLVLVATWLIPVVTYMLLVRAVQGKWFEALVHMGMMAGLLFLCGLYMVSGLMGMQTGHKELRATILAVPCDGVSIVHESPFSALPAKVMMRDVGCVREHIVVTELTVEQGRTSGFDVVPEDETIRVDIVGWEGKLPKEFWYFKAGAIPPLPGNETLVHVEDGLNLTYVTR